MLDQKKIGRFIAERRKLAGMTQKQLAEKLNVSDKAVSKWETGRSMPDNGILMDLCDNLQINVNELLSGEMLSEDSYHGKAEENMVELIETSEKERNLRKRTWSGMVMGVVVLAISLWLMILVSQGDVLWFVDTVSLLAIVAAAFAVLLAAGQMGDFVGAFAISMGKRKAVEAAEVKRGIAACRNVMAAAVLSGVIVTLIGIIAVFSQRVGTDVLGANICVALLSTLYGLVAALFLFPVVGRLEKLLCGETAAETAVMGQERQKNRSADGEK